MAFQKGQSGNPSGRPKITPEELEVRTLARKYTDAAIERLAYWMKAGDARASVTAAQALLDRGYGKPSQPVSGDAENPLQTIINVVTGVPRD